MQLLNNITFDIKKMKEEVAHQIKASIEDGHFPEAILMNPHTLYLFTSSRSVMEESLHSIISGDVGEKLFGVRFITNIDYDQNQWQLVVRYNENKKI